MYQVTGTLTAIEWFDRSRNGNSRYYVTLQAGPYTETFYTAPNSGLAGQLSHYLDKRVTVQLKTVHNRRTLQTIELAD